MCIDIHVYSIMLPISRVSKQRDRGSTIVLLNGGGDWAEQGLLGNFLLLRQNDPTTYKLVPRILFIKQDEIPNLKHNIP